MPFAAPHYIRVHPWLKVFFKVLRILSGEGFVPADVPRLAGLRDVALFNHATA